MRANIYIKQIFMFVLLFLFVANPYHVKSQTRDSHFLSANDKLFTDLDPIDEITVGTVITWPFAANPDGYNSNESKSDWLECDGRSIPPNFKELIKLVGNKTPDYRGAFLRGHGGRSKPVGERQDYAIHIDETNDIKLRIDNVATGVHTWSASFYSDWDRHESGVAKFVSSPTGNTLGIGNEDMKIETRIESLAGETRPVNKAVRYFIRTR